VDGRLCDVLAQAVTFLNKLRKERTGKAVDVDVIDGPIDDDVRRRLFAIGNETVPIQYIA